MIQAQQQQQRSAQQQAASGLEEVSFHMSGTEAVMAAVRCARFNAERPLVVTFGGAYHGWWDGMQVRDTAEITPRSHPHHAEITPRSRRDHAVCTCAAGGW